MSELKTAAGVVLLFFGATFVNVGVIAAMTSDVPGGLIALVLGSLMTWGGIRLWPRWRLALAVLCGLYGVGVLGALTFEENRGQAIPAFALAAFYVVIGTLLLCWHISARKAPPA